MRTLLLESFVLAIAPIFVACGGSTKAMLPGETGGTTDFGQQPQGGTTSGIGGRDSSGGVATTGGASTGPGGSAEATGGAGDDSGGATSVGGAHATGGTSTHPASTTGGSIARTGGATSTGGSLGTGGVRTTGGTGGLSTGGTRSSVGTETGGTVASGGAQTGGTKATGGTQATAGAGTTAGSPGTGGNVTQWPKKFCGNITTGEKTDPTGLKFAKHWDQITAENAGKWTSVQSSVAGAFNWTVLDAIYASAEQDGLIFKEHSFVWGSAQLSGVTTAAVENWIKSFCQRYTKVALIDVVNEPPPHTVPSYATVLAAGESGTYGWITKSFKLARQYCGSAVLILNDYQNIEYASTQSHFIDIVNDIKAAGAPIDAVGAEAHDAYNFTASELQVKIDTLSSLTGLPIYVTEYDVNKSDDAAQLEIYKAQFPVFWSTSTVRGVTLWGWITGKTWVQSSGLVNGTSPRPAMNWLMDYLGRPAPP